MRVWARTHLATVETGNRLVFRVVREAGWLEWCLEALAAGFILWELYRQHNVLWIVVVILVAIAAIGSSIRGKTTRLTVTPNQLTVEGNIGQLLNGEIRIDVCDIESLGYESGGKHEASGFNARRNRGRTCLLSGLNEQQSIEIATAIFKRFPDIGSGDTKPGSILFGRNSEPVTLGLSRNE